MLEGLRGEESIATLCRREGIADSLYYSWSKEALAEQMLENRLLKKSMTGHGGDQE